MNVLFTYYLIGLIVSMFNIWFYRYSKYKYLPSRNDALLALLGVWLWPIQIILFSIQFYKKFKIKKWQN